MLFRGERRLLVDRRRQRTASPYGDLIIAGRAVDIVDQERRLGLVAGREEARHRQNRRHRIAHRHRTRSGAELVGAPRDRHQAQLAVEVWHVERHRDGAAFADFHRPFKKRDRLHRHNGQALAAELVAAEALCGAQIGVENAAIIIAHIDAEPLLAIVVRYRVRRREFRQPKDAFIDRRDRQAHLLPARRAGDLDRRFNLLARPNKLRRIDRDLERLRTHVEPDISDAHRPPWDRPLHGVARRNDGRQHIETGAPGGVRRDGNFLALVADLEALDRMNLVSRNSDDRFARVGRIEIELRCAARRDFLAGDGERRLIGGIGAGLVGAPADIEADVRRRLRRRICRRQSIGAGIEHLLDARRAGDFCFRAALSDQNVLVRPSPAPLAVFAVPVEPVVFFDEAPFKARRRLLAVAVDKHRVDFGRRVLRKAVAVAGKLEAEITIVRAHRDARAFAYDAPAGLDDADDEVGAQRRAIVLRSVIDAKLDARLAGGVSRSARKRQEPLVKAAVRGAETITLKRGERFGVKPQPRLALNAKGARGRAIEIARLDADIARLIAAHRRLFIDGELHLNTLRHEVFDRECLRPDKPCAVRLRFNAPETARRRARNLVIEGEPADIELVDALLQRFGRIRPEDSHGERPVGGAARAVAHEARDMRGLARAIDAAIKIEIGVDDGRRGAPVDVAIGKIKRRAIEVERGEILFGAIGHDHARRQRIFSVDGGLFEAGAPVGGRRRQREDVVV